MRRVLLAVTFAVVARYYLWAVQASGERFHWGYDLGGYYNFLARGFLSGHLYVPIEPAPQLLAAANPWDPAANNEHKIHDMAFYRGRYYLYHGAGPAILLFVPWRLAAGFDVPENFAVFLFCSGGLLFSCLLLLRIFELADVRPGPVLVAAIPLVLGLCQSVPYLLNRVKVYETAIAGGYFCLSAAFYLVARGLGSARAAIWFGGAGAMFGFAIACRPHLGLAGAIALIGVAVHRRRLVSREVAALALPMAAIGLAVAAYNYARFGDPFEFGIRHLLSGLHQNRIRLQAANLLHGAYYFLACPPDSSAVFPWVHMKMCAPPDEQFPPGYVIEATTGAFFLAPFLPAVLWWIRPSGGARTLVAILLASGAAILGFHMATGWTTQRYIVDCLPMLTLAACACACVGILRASGKRRVALAGSFALLALAGAVVNLALAMTGPYDDILRNRPANYLRLAGWFSPSADSRPRLNPPLAISFTARFTPQEDGTREPLVTVGRYAYSYSLHAEHRGQRVRIVSFSEGSTVEAEIAREGAHAFEVAFLPGTGEVTVNVNGARLFAHAIKTWVTAPAQVDIGVNRVDPARTGGRAVGTLEHLSLTGSSTN